MGPFFLFYVAHHNLQMVTICALLYATTQVHCSALPRCIGLPFKMNGIAFCFQDKHLQSRTPVTCNSMLAYYCDGQCWPVVIYWRWERIISGYWPQVCQGAGDTQQTNYRSLAISYFFRYFQDHFQSWTLQEKNKYAPFSPLCKV